MMVLGKSFWLKGFDKPRYPIFQKGMGAGISLYELATAVGKEDGVGTISSVGLDQFTSKRIGEKLNQKDATKKEIEDTKKDGGIAAINIMVALRNHYRPSVEGAVEGGVNIIVSGAGLPKNLPGIVNEILDTNNHKINLMPKVSSVDVAKLITKLWEKKYGYIPNGFVLEGPLAGGHLAWKNEELSDPDFYKKNSLENLFYELKEFAQDIPIIPAGGIYTHEDAVRYLDAGAVAVGFATIFAPTKESSASKGFKDAYINSTEDDIIITTKNWGSPFGYPFRVIRSSPLVQEWESHPERWINKENPDSDERSYCICSNLLGTADIDKTKLLEKGKISKHCSEGYALRPDGTCPAFGNVNYNKLVTAGTNAVRVSEEVPVKQVMDALKGL
ncbi:nitronate monooxygenase [Candidatus Woesearchaeota archaeon]|nr:nitronate monooxygenase [Candidatus Woesearchaeota archaeon]